MYKQVFTVIAFLQEVTWVREVPQLAAAPCCWQKSVTAFLLAAIQRREQRTLGIFVDAKQKTK